VGHGETRYPKVPWGDISASDLCEEGEPELVRDFNQERQIGLSVRGTYGIVLGILALRCEWNGRTIMPLTMAIADTPIIMDDDLVRAHSSSRPRRGDKAGD
jgi:hypothetical protein